MKRRLTAVACGVGLISGSFIGNSTPASAPESAKGFASRVLDDPAKCAATMRSIMPGQGLYQDPVLREATYSRDLRMQESICRVAIRVGNALLTAARTEGPTTSDGFMIRKQHTGFNKKVEARGPGDRGMPSFDASYRLLGPSYPSGPPNIVEVNGAWDSDNHTTLYVRLKKVHLSEGVEVWDFSANQQKKGEPEEPYVDATQEMTTMADFDRRVERTLTAITALGNLPLPGHSK